MTFVQLVIKEAKQRKSFKSHFCGIWLPQSPVCELFHYNNICLKDNGIALLLYTTSGEVR